MTGMYRVLGNVAPGLAIAGLIRRTQPGRKPMSIPREVVP
jgi:hypothetical protein